MFPGLRLRTPRVSIAVITFLQAKKYPLDGGPVVRWLLKDRSGRPAGRRLAGVGLRLFWPGWRSRPDRLTGDATEKDPVLLPGCQLSQPAGLFFHFFRQRVLTLNGVIDCIYSTLQRRHLGCCQ